MHTEFFAHTEIILDEPGAPEEVKVFEIPDDRRSRGICVLTLQLSHPSDVALDEIPHLSYFVYYHGQQREVITAATSNIFVVQNCTPDLLINVTAVNRCGNMGGSVIGIAPEFLSVTEVPTVTVAPNHANAGRMRSYTESSRAYYCPLYYYTHPPPNNYKLMYMYI